MYFCRNPSCKGNSNCGKKRGSYKYTKGFRHEGRLHQHISSSIECEKVYKSQSLVFFKGIEKKKVFDLTTSTPDTFNKKTFFQMPCEIVSSDSIMPSKKNSNHINFIKQNEENLYVKYGISPLKIE